MDLPKQRALWFATGVAATYAVWWFSVSIITTVPAPVPKFKQVERIAPPLDAIGSMDLSVQKVNTASGNSSVEFPLAALRRIKFPLFAGKGIEISSMQLGQLGISEAAATAIGAQVSKAIGALQSIEAKLATKEHGNNGEYIRIPPFPAEGEAIRSELEREIRAVVADGRVDLIMSSLSQDFRMGAFGQIERELSADLSPQTNTWGYSVKMASVNQNSPPTLGGNMFNDTIEARFNHLLSQFK